MAKRTTREQAPLRRLFHCAAGARGPEYRLYEATARELWRAVEICEQLQTALPDGAPADAAQQAREIVAELLFTFGEGRTVPDVATPGSQVAGVLDRALNQLAGGFERLRQRRLGRDPGDGKAAASGPN